MWIFAQVLTLVFTLDIVGFVRFAFFFFFYCRFTCMEQEKMHKSADESTDTNLDQMLRGV